MKVITITNLKGGTGKKTVALNLAVAAERDDTKTVLIKIHRYVILKD
jgi:cellulose biosynthesis protein BcsQ